MDCAILKKATKWNEFMATTSKINTMVVVKYDECTKKTPWPYRENFNARIDWESEAYFRRMERMNYLDDDTVPYLRVLTGTEIFAEALGCAVHKSDNMPFALPAIYDVKDINNIKVPKICDSTLNEQFEYVYRLRERVGSDNILSLPDIQSAVDVAALVMEKSEFLMAMITDPEALKELILKCEELLINFLDEWFKSFDTKYIAHYPHYYMEGGLTFSEDEIGEFSAEMFEEFCLPSINKMSNRYGGCGIHCCANSFHQWENFKKIEGLRALNLVQPAKIIDKAINTIGLNICHLHECQDLGSQLIHPWQAEADKSAHIAITAYASSKEDAIEKLKMLREFEAKRCV